MKTKIDQFDVVIPAETVLKMRKDHAETDTESGTESGRLLSGRQFHATRCQLDKHEGIK